MIEGVSEGMLDIANALHRARVNQGVEVTIIGNFFGEKVENVAVHFRETRNESHAVCRSSDAVERESTRVRLLRLAPYSIDIDVFAYVFARDWNGFLEIQEQLLLGALDIVEEAGSELALPSQSIYVSRDARAVRGSRERQAVQQVT